MTSHETASLEPSTEALAGRGPARVLKRLLRATRPMFFPASVLPVVVGTSWGYREAHALDAVTAALALAAVVVVHAAANVLNDVFDEDTDRVNGRRIHPYTGGSRFIQNQVMSRQAMAVWGFALVLLGTILGAALLFQAGPGVLGFGMAGLALAVLYSAPPARLSARGVGEAAVGVGFGVLPVMGAAWLQTGHLSPAAFAVSLPVSLWVASILLINEVPDRDADRDAGKRTLAVRLALPDTRRLYLGLQLLAIGLAVLYGVVGLLAPVSIAVLLLLPAALKAARALGGSERSQRRGIELTLLVHTAGSLWLALCAAAF